MGAFKKVPHLRLFLGSCSCTIFIWTAIVQSVLDKLCSFRFLVILLKGRMAFVISWVWVWLSSCAFLRQHIPPPSIPTNQSPTQCHSVLLSHNYITGSSYKEFILVEFYVWFHSLCDCILGFFFHRNPCIYFLLM